MYDKVNYKFLFIILKKLKVFEKFILQIKFFYYKTKIKIYINDDIEKKFYNIK